MALQPTYPMVNKGLLYINGLGMSYLTTTTVAVATGQARDSTNINDINLTTGVTLNTALSGVNGLDQGTLAASTIYAVYAIGNSTANDPSVNVDASTGGTFQPAQTLMSLSFTAPALPTGYDMFRRIGSVLLDGSKNILEFVQSGSDFYYVTPIASNITAGASASYVAVVLTNIIPVTARKVYAPCTLTADAGAARSVRLISGFASSTARGTATNYNTTFNAAASAVVTEVLSCPCSTTPATAIYYNVSNTSAAVLIDIIGFQDTL